MVRLRSPLLQRPPPVPSSSAPVQAPEKRPHAAVTAPIATVVVQARTSRGCPRPAPLSTPRPGLCLADDVEAAPHRVELRDPAPAAREDLHVGDPPEVV